VHEILARVEEGQYVLDLGARHGSFRREECHGITIGADLEDPGQPRPENFVICDAAYLPFPRNRFTAVIANHCLEHFDDPRSALAEAGRVLAMPGYLYVAVPDADTFTDRVYRWIGRGGGHVQRFTSIDQVRKLAEDSAGTPLVGWRLLHTSLSFLNRRNIDGRIPGKMLLFAGGSEAFLRVLTRVLRWADAAFGGNWSVYGWAAYFGSTIEVKDTAWTNVCVRCGAGHAAEWLLREGRVRRTLILRAYRCPGCGATNYFTGDRARAR
jgi:SAM-dependent methyltransferase